jgi:hypothetical protein
MESALLPEVILQCLHFGLAATGAYALSLFVFDAKKGNIPVLLRIFLGALPYVSLQCLFSLLFWNDGLEHTAIVRGMQALKLFYVFGGLLFLRRHGLAFFKRIPGDFIAMCLVLLAIYLPSLLLRSPFHPSWDSDTVIFWLRKLEILIEHSFFQKWSDTVDLHAYVSFLLQTLSLLLHRGGSTLELLVSTRLLLCFLTAIALWDLSRGFSRFWKLASLAVLLSGFPLKWINLYQDVWLSVFILFWFQALFSDPDRKAPFPAVASLAMLAGMKNEGGLYAFFLSLLTLLLYHRDFFRHPLKLLGFGLFLPFLLWKATVARYGLHLLQVQSLSWDEFQLRGFAMLELLGRGIGRQYQSWLLDACLALLVLLVSYRFISSTSRWALFAAGIIFFLPLSVVLWTSLDFPWLLSTTLSRVTIPACLLVIYIALKEGEKRISISLTKAS